ncbi:MAG TPA: hypothetical protein VGU74_05090 [Gemmatimonadales bacterium]|nr:hypothetical protein [Gemmatimonadales bacterium]
MPPEVVFLSAITIVGAFVLLFPVVRGLAERIRGRGDAGVRDELQSFREDLVQDSQDARREIAELSERVDFLERFIAKQREAERLPPVG